MCFLLLYRLPEALSVKLLYPFFSDAIADGGLGLDKAAYGMVYGTAGVIALLAGGILGGWHISRRGLRRCLLPMALSLALPCAVYLFLALTQPASVWTVGACVVFDQFGYGYGFTAYTVYMMYFADGPLKPTVRSRPPTTRSAPASWPCPCCCRAPWQDICKRAWGMWGSTSW